MARFGAQWDDWEQGKAHKARAIKKMQRIQGLKDLLETWEQYEADNGHTEHDHRMVLDIRARLRAAQNQLEAMAV